MPSLYNMLDYSPTTLSKNITADARRTI